MGCWCMVVVGECWGVEEGARGPCDCTEGPPVVLEEKGRPRVCTPPGATPAIVANARGIAAAAALVLLPRPPPLGGGALGPPPVGLPWSEASAAGGGPTGGSGVLLGGDVLGGGVNSGEFATSIGLCC